MQAWGAGVEVRAGRGRPWSLTVTEQLIIYCHELIIGCVIFISWMKKRFGKLSGVTQLVSGRMSPRGLADPSPLCVHGKWIVHLQTDGR